MAPLGAGLHPRFGPPAAPAGAQTPARLRCGPQIPSAKLGASRRRPPSGLAAVSVAQRAPRIASGRCARPSTGRRVRYVMGQLESPAPRQRLCCRDGETAAACGVHRTPRSRGVHAHRPAPGWYRSTSAGPPRGDRSEVGSARCILPPSAFRFASVQPRAAVASPAESATATHLHDFKLTHYRAPEPADSRARGVLQTPRWTPRATRSRACSGEAVT